jgi:hypothetical protein
MRSRLLLERILGPRSWYHVHLLNSVVEVSPINSKNSLIVLFRPDLTVRYMLDSH